MEITQTEILALGLCALAGAVVAGAALVAGAIVKSARIIHQPIDLHLKLPFVIPSNAASVAAGSLSDIANSLRKMQERPVKVDLLEKLRVAEKAKRRR